MKRDATSGMTLIEVTIVAALMSTVLLVGTTVWINTLKVWEVERNYSDINMGMRTISWRLTEELSMAALVERPSLEPPVAGLYISPEDNTSITFQKTLSSDETVWSGLIMVRLRNEDVNGNLLLDSGEDVDGNGVLDRVVERLEDKDGSGDFEQQGEVTILGREIDTLTFVLNDNILEVSLSARKYGSLSHRELSYANKFRVRLLD